MKIHEQEIRIITKIVGDGTLTGIATDNEHKLYDIHFSWTDEKNYRHSAWLPLAYINRFSEWYREPIVSMSDIPEMARDGDWSAIRDSEVSTIWQIFDYVKLNNNIWATK